MPGTDWFLTQIAATFVCPVTLVVERGANRGDACEVLATDKMSVVQRGHLPRRSPLGNVCTAFLVYRRAVGDGRASQPQSRRGAEYRFRRRRTRCPSSKDGAPRTGGLSFE